MNLNELKLILTQHSGKKILFRLPDQTTIPQHFHITEVGHVVKNFIDCGGELRQTSTCLLQAWTANDTDHSLSAGKLRSILSLSDRIFPAEPLSVEIEFETPYISQFPVISYTIESDTLFFQLGVKHTDCLAKEKCGIEPASTPSPCCSPQSGCC